MATRTIPERTEVVCDACMSVTGQGRKPRRTSTRLVLHRHALDYLGNPAADGTIGIDLCDECATVITGAINSATERIRKEAADDR